MTIDTLVQDVRYAWRHIQRSPGFALAAILTLALGIGANTAMFSMLNVLTLKRLPIESADELIAIAPRSARGLARSTPMSAVEELGRNGPLQHVCAYLGSVAFPVLANEMPVQTSTTFVTGQCFAALGVTPMLGRAITDADSPIHGPGAHIAVISHRLWTRSFNNDPAILGRTLQVNNVDVAIVGVLPPGFVGLEIDHGIDIFTPFDAVLPAGPTRRQLASYILGRLRPGVTLEHARAEIETRWPALLESVLPASLAPSERAQLLDSTPRLERMGTGTSRLRERYVQPIRLVLGVTALLLLLACVNLGGLLLARLDARTSELSVRLALGGTRRRIAQQMLVESLLLSTAGALLAVPMAYSTATTLASFMPPVNVPYEISFAPDLRVLAATTSMAFVVGVAMTAVPVWIAMRHRPALHVSWDRTIVGATSGWARSLLVAQVALSVVILVEAGLLARSLYLLNTGDLGIRTEHILNVKLGTLPNAAASRVDRAIYYPALLEKIAALPGVSSAALASTFPRVSASTAGIPVTWHGEEQKGLETSLDFISPEFFETMGIRLLAGRNVTWQDHLQTQAVAVINESLARALSPDGDVLGRAITLRTLPTDRSYVIVGIAADASQGNPRNAHPRLVYAPLLQVGAGSSLNPNLLIETTDQAAVAGGVRQILRDGGRDYAQEIISLDDLLARAPATERMSASVAAVVGLLAAVLALIGVHGALAYSVSRRKREIGVRIAIGATPAVLARGVVREALAVTALGVALGLPAALVAARSLRSLMFGITETDAGTFGAVTIFFLLLGVVAGLRPAARAARVDPVIALRAE